MKKIVNKLLNCFGFKLSTIDKTAHYYENIFEKYKDFTMVPKLSYIENLKMCAKNNFLKGCVVECGTWKGGMIAGIAEVLDKKNRKYYLFDSFEGLPTAKVVDGIKAIQWQKDINSKNYHNNCWASVDDAMNVMKLAGIDSPEIIKGWFEHTLPTVNFQEPIAFLRLDGDWYESILTSLKYLFPKVIKGGFIFIDDYYVWDGTSRAVHKYLSEIQSQSKIRYLFDGIAYIVKED